MMTDPLTWSPINLGRWFGTQVRIHYFLIVFVVLSLLSALLSGGPATAATAAWIALLFLALFVHELGHALMAAWLGCEHDEVRLWPLGNMVGPVQAARTADNALVALAGPAASAAVVLITAIVLHVAGAQFVWNPFGNTPDTGAPRLLNVAQNPLATPLSWIWLVGWFGYLNWVLMLLNLIPALPFDNGRLLRSYLANSSVPSSKDGIIPLWTAHSCAALLVLVGLVRMFVHSSTDSFSSGGITVIMLAILIELMVRAEARMMEDGGFFEEGLFGYDFSEGYTSLEGSAAKVRPYRESALKRWRRRRSELRRQRRQAREAAEERRMDEILEKLHREGRSALTDEEHRFLVRVSAKIRNRPKARD
jgi:Zn-dependent protease